MPAARKFPPSRVLARIESETKKYPPIARSDSGTWEAVSDDDPDVFVFANDPFDALEVTVDEDESDVRIVTPAEVQRSAHPTVPLGPPAVLIAPPYVPPAPLVPSVPVAATRARALILVAGLAAFAGASLGAFAGAYAVTHALAAKPPASSSRAPLEIEPLAVTPLRLRF